MSSFRKSVSVYRKDGGGYVNGRWVEGGETLINIQASIQPADKASMESDMMRNFLEGRRDAHGYRLYTSTKLNTVTDKNPDQVLIDGERFEVLSVENWQADVINHYKVLVVKIHE